MEAKRIAAVIREFRRLDELPEGTMAKEAFMTLKRYREIEAGNVLPNQSELERIAWVIGLSGPVLETLSRGRSAYPKVGFCLELELRRMFEILGRDYFGVFLPPVDYEVLDRLPPNVLVPPPAPCFRDFWDRQKTIGFPTIPRFGSKFGEESGRDDFGQNLKH